jgi:hypothetical protein
LTEVPPLVVYLLCRDFPLDRGVAASGRGAAACCRVPLFAAGVSPVAAVLIGDCPLFLVITELCGNPCVTAGKASASFLLIWKAAV